MAEEIRNKFVSWTQNIVKEIKEIPAKNPYSNFYGVGINLTLMQPTKAKSSDAVSASTPNNNRVGVDSVEPNGPAAKAGLQSGDVIVEVEGKKFDYNNGSRVYLPDDVAGAIRGPEGSTVGVVVERDGKRVGFVLTREPIGVAAVASPPSSPVKKRGQEKKKEVARQSKSKSEKQGEKRRENEKPRKIKQSKEKVGNASCDGQKKNDNENMTPDDAVGSLESLALSEEEHKENKDLTSSIEDNDQFDHDDTAPHHHCATSLLSRSNSNTDDNASEEKTIDNNDNEEISSIINSVGDDSSQWEMISERSGSAIVVSFSGSMTGASFRSASPSVLKNRFVLTESTGEAYINHIVLPTDTLQGLCLAYKISATRLRMENKFSGNSLQMAPKKLKIPSGKTAHKGMMIRTQDTTSKEYKLYAFVAEIPSMELVEAKAYLDLSSWDLEEALRSAREDDGWSLKGGGFEPPPSTVVVVDDGLSSSMMISAVARPKALTAQDIYAAPPPFEGDGFELKDIKRTCEN